MSKPKTLEEAIKNVLKAFQEWKSIDGDLFVSLTHLREIYNEGDIINQLLKKENEELKGEVVRKNKLINLCKSQDTITNQELKKENEALKEDLVRRQEAGDDLYSDLKNHIAHMGKAVEDYKAAVEPIEDEEESLPDEEDYVGDKPDEEEEVANLTCEECGEIIRQIEFEPDLRSVGEHERYTRYIGPSPSPYFALPCKHRVGLSVISKIIVGEQKPTKPEDEAVEDIDPAKEGLTEVEADLIRENGELVLRVRDLEKLLMEAI